MTLTLIQIWVLLAEAVGVLIIDKKLLSLYIPVILLTIVMFFFSRDSFTGNLIVLYSNEIPKDL